MCNVCTSTSIVYKHCAVNHVHKYTSTYGRVNHVANAFCCPCQVKVLYVRNLMLSTTEATIEEVFSLQAPVERVKKIKDYAFVHFTTREDAMQALQRLNGELIFALLLMICLFF